MSENYEPKGIKFIDKNLGEMILVQDESCGFNGWVCRKHPDGQWVSFRKATEADLESLQPVITKAQREKNERDNQESG